MASVLTLALPKYVAFKGDNDYYLCVREHQGRPRLMFVADDIKDPTVQMEIFVAKNGNIHIKHTSSGKFWSLSNPEFIFADVDDTSDDNMNTMFRPVKVNSNSIALLNLGNDKFCKRYTDVTLKHGLNAKINFTDFFSRLKVEEPVMKREISNIKYNFDKSRVYDNETIILAEDSATNTNQEFITTVDFKFLYEDVKTTIWKTNLSLKLEAKDLFDVISFPVVVGGKVELFDQKQRDNELDETMITTTIMSDERTVVVQPMTRVAVTLIATKCKCDVPFTFMQSDTLYNGKTFKTEVEGVYTGSCYSDLEFQIKPEPLDS